MTRINRRQFSKQLIETLSQSKLPLLELIYLYRIPLAELPYISNSREAYDFLLKAWNHDTIALHEEVKVCLLNHRGRALGVYTVGLGGVSSCTARINHIIGVAILANASAIILAHNHPSGTTTPSMADEALTKKVHGATQFFEIQLNDHLIVTPSGYYSFADEGRLPIKAAA